MSKPTDEGKSELLTQASVRKARPSDFQPVVSGIGAVYGNRDWLADKFHDFLDDPDIAAYVIELEGHGVVGFYMAQYLDEGRTLIKRAGRIHPDFRGKGLFKYLGEFLIQDAKDRGTVEREMMVALKDTTPRVQKLDYHLKSVMNMYYIDVTLSDLPSINPTEFSDVHKMTWSDMELFFDSPETWNKLIPTGFLFVESLPLQRYKSNIKRLVNHRTDCFMSFKRDGESIDEKEKNATKCDVELSDLSVKSLSMISFGHRFHVKTGMAYNIDLFSDNFDHLFSHIKCHIANMKSHKKNNLYLQVTVNDNRREYVHGLVKTIFSSFGIQVEPNNQDTLFEKRF